jgi:hypothetical protein
VKLDASWIMREKKVGREKKWILKKQWRGEEAVDA